MSFGQLCHKGDVTPGHWRRNLAIPDRRSAPAQMTTRISEGCHGRQFRKEAVCWPALSAHPPAIGLVADPDRGGARHFAELYQPDRAQPAPGDGADPAAAGGSL